MKDLIDRFYAPQPAPLSYPFDGGWQVMKYVRENVFSRTDASARGYYKQAEPRKLEAETTGSTIPKYWKYCIYLGFMLAGFSQYISAMLIVSIFLVLQFVVLIIWAVLATITATLLAGVTFLYGQFYKIYYRCPDCHEQMRIPIYVCPVCATEHSRLWPSPYGILHHRCATCNTKLPTLDLMGRKELVQKCAHCGAPMSRDVGRLTNLHIPVVGGPNTGKSNYIFTATQAFIDDYAGPRGYEVEFSDEDHRVQYETNMASLASGNVLVKTTTIVPQAYNLSIKKPHQRVGRIVYLYDAAGEAYSDEENTLLQTYYPYAHGIIFIVDPFSINAYYRENEEEIKELRSQIQPGPVDVMSSYERMLFMLESTKKTGGQERFPYPIAIVVTKTDALALEEVIGRPAAQELMLGNDFYRFEQQAIDTLVQEFLSAYGLGNLVRDVQMRFKDVGFFSCSALGRLPYAEDKTAFEPMRVLDPFLWLLNQTGVAELRKEQAIIIDAEDKIYSAAHGGIFGAAKYYYWDSLRPKSRDSMTQ
jgi:hypothetical protein